MISESQSFRSSKIVQMSVQRLYKQPFSRKIVVDKTWLAVGWVRPSPVSMGLARNPSGFSALVTRRYWHVDVPEPLRSAEIMLMPVVLGCSQKSHDIASMLTYHHGGLLFFFAKSFDT